MKRTLFLFGFLAAVLLFSNCSTSKAPDTDFIDANIQSAIVQEKLQVEAIEKSGKILNPRTVDSGKIKYISMEDWTSGFYPGTMWYMYELSGDSVWKTYARKYS